MFFRIERIGPPGGGPARYILPVRCPHPHIPGLIRDELLVFISVPGSYNQALLKTSSLCAITRVVFRSSWYIPARVGPRRYASPRVTLMRATLPAASPQALRAPHSDRQTPPSLAPFLPFTASHPRVGTGNVSRPRLRVGPAIPPPSPTPAHRSHCPPIGRFAASAFGASAQID